MYGKKWRKKCVCKSKLFDSGNYFNSNKFCSTKTKVTKSRTRKDRQIDIMWSLYLMRTYFSRDHFWCLCVRIVITISSHKTSIDIHQTKKKIMMRMIWRIFRENLCLRFINCQLCSYIIRRYVYKHLSSSDGSEPMLVPSSHFFSGWLGIDILRRARKLELFGSCCMCTST